MQVYSGEALLIGLVVWNTVFTVAFIPLASGRTMHILKAEMPGPVIGKLVSKVQDCTNFM